jgi:hypothetical protein
MRIDDPVVAKHEEFAVELREKLLDAIDPVMRDTQFPTGDEVECGLIALWALATLGADVALVMGNGVARIDGVVRDVGRYALDIEPARVAERMTRHTGKGEA